MLQLTSSGETMMSPTVLLKRTIYFLASNCTKYYQVTSVLLCPVFFLATHNRKPQIHFRVVKALSVEHTSTVLYTKFRWTAQGRSEQTSFKKLSPFYKLRKTGSNYQSFTIWQSVLCFHRTHTFTYLLHYPTPLKARVLSLVPLFTGRSDSVARD